MIPKIIHYCWFGRREMPQLSKDCIASWHRYMPDWEFKLWNEDNFDVNCNQYVKEAYQSSKYAFVSDFVRLWALSKWGGVYFDTGVEVIQPFNDLMNLPGFICYENSADKSVMALSTATIGASLHNLWISEQLLVYENRHFRIRNKKFDLTPNPITIVKKMKDEGFDFSFDYPAKVYKDCMCVFPPEYFSPLMSPNNLQLTVHTFCIHHFIGSWTNPLPKWKELLKPFKRKIKLILKNLNK